MLSVWVIKSVATIVISFLIGFLFFYMVSPLKRGNKKQLLEEVISLLINFVIYIWIGKILWNISTFIQDPLAVLAYPSNSNAFYIAFILISIHIGYKIKRDQLQLGLLLYSFVPIFISASFMYEFIQMIIFDDGGSWIYLGVLMVLIIVWMFLDGRVSNRTTILILILGWTIGKLILTLTLPYSTIFGYMLTPLFFIILLMLLCIASLIKKTR